ncbi:MAG: sigma-54 dependent transcriptional regulator [Calditrichia bacterium]
MNPILIVDNEIKFCKAVQAGLELENLPAEYRNSGEDALKWLKENSCEVVLTDIKMDGMSGIDLLRQIKSAYPSIEVIVMTAFASQKTAVEALREGAMDYLIKPFEMEELILRIKRISEQKKILAENLSLKSRTEKPVYYSQIIGRSDPMKEVYRLIEKAAGTDSNILILGESGTGKELVAEAIHSSSNRKDMPFLAINCAALFEIANGGTIFLDEIGDMSLPLQAKLLRVLQNKEIFRLGGNQSIRVNSRVIAATNRDLEAMVQEKAFREDLFYRLNVFPIKVPPLRERKEDIPELVNHFIKSSTIVAVDRLALNKLMEHDWPGNIRELQNVIERASIMSDAVITPDHLPDWKATGTKMNYDFQIPESGFDLDAFEAFLINRALKMAKGNKTTAAKILGITRRRLYSMMKSLNLDL